MKIRNLLIAILLLLTLTACKKTEEAVEVTAKTVLPQNEISVIIGYTPKEEEKLTRVCKEITYKNETRGASDIVNVKVYPPNTKNSPDYLKKLYDEQKKKCEQYSSLVETGADNSFIAFPSVYLYKNGYYVVITAGSGGDDAQIEMLKKLAEIADKNIEAMAPEEVAEEDSDVPKKQEKDSTKKNQKS